MIRFVPAEGRNSGGVQLAVFVHLRQGHRRLIVRNRIVHGDGRTQSVPVLHQHLHAKTQLAGLAVGFPIQHALGISRALVRVVAPLFPMKVDRRIAGIIVFGRGHPGLIAPVLTDKALQAGPRFDERAVGRKCWSLVQPSWRDRSYISTKNSFAASAESTRS